MIITESAAARKLGVTKQAVNKWKNKKARPAFFVEVEGKIGVDDAHPAFIEILENSDHKLRANKKRSATKKKKAAAKKATPEYKPPEISADMILLNKQATIADLNKVIYDSEIKKERVKQETINTLEKKKDLAPIELMKHFFSFAENMINRLYRRPHEISPQLKALYMAGEDRKADQMIVKEMESIIKDTVKELVKELESAGFEYKKS